mmetsp:Transcript_49365/g.139793  ORF Transcript_49365/g.139793 Transcript_49365/m.139793 type:complete len:382 (-) Transcript_49365:567-1712(-)
MSSKFASFVSQVPSNGERPSLSARTSFTNETHMKEATPSDTQPFVDGATTTTIFMNRDGRGMKAPVVVNSHRLRLSPDAERLVGANTSPEDSHPVNTELDAENVGSSEAVSSYMSSTQVSTPKVNKLSDFVSKLSSHDAESTGAGYGKTAYPDKFGAISDADAEGVPPPASRRPSKLAEFLQAQPGPAVQPGVKAERKPPMQPIPQDPKASKRVSSPVRAAPSTLSERRKADESWVTKRNDQGNAATIRAQGGAKQAEEGYGSSVSVLVSVDVSATDDNTIDELSAILSPTTTGTPNKEREPVAYEASMLEKLRPQPIRHQDRSSTAEHPTAEHSSAPEGFIPPPPPPTDAEKREGWMRFSCMPSNIMSSCNPQVPARVGS